LDKACVLEIRGLSKHFGGVKAVNNVDMKLYDGEIIAIVGDNGAGKSTLIKIISGVYKGDSGKIYINNEEAIINNPDDAKNYGIETVYQEEGLIQILDVASNLFLGRERLRNDILGRLFKFVDYKYMRNEAEKLLGRFKIKIKNIDGEVRTLSGGQRQALVVGRAVYWGKKIIILDEPTNNLGVNEQRQAINLIKQLRDEYDMSIIIISHNLYHVFELVDRIIVLGNGEKIGERIKGETTTNEIVSMITGVAV
jgi:ABC-type sugar transport system ATPase subunit